MRRLGLVALVALAASGAFNGVVLGSRSPAASCVGAITSLEATQLGPGAVGAEVSGLATAGPSLGRDLVSGLAREHGPVEQCAEAAD